MSYARRARRSLVTADHLWYCESWLWCVIDMNGSLSVLLVDDEPVISLDLCDTLLEAGFRVIGPAATMPTALTLLILHKPDLAVIDIKFRNKICLDLARQLKQRNIPFIVYTGYPRDSADVIEFREAPRLEKPALPSELLKALTALAVSSVREGHLSATSDKTASSQALMSRAVR